MNNINKELIETYEEYIKLLGKENNSLISLAFVHGWRTSEEDIKKGEELRAKIKELKDSLSLKG